MAETKLSRQTRERIDAHHETAVKRALAAETLGQRELSSAVRNTTAELVTRLVGVDPGAAPSVHRTIASRAIQEGTRGLTDAAARAALKTRSEARLLAQQQVGDAVGDGIAAAGATFEVPPERLPTLSVTSIPGGAEQDAAAAALVGARVANRWGSVAMAGLLTWQRSGGGVEGLIRQLSKARDETGARVNQEAATEAFDAFADEHQGAMRATLAAAPRAFRTESDPARGELWDILGTGAGGGDQSFDVGLPLGWGEGFMSIWSGILDRKMCPRCMELDGNMVPVGNEWPGAGRPPTHASCRCVEVTLWIPELYAKRLPGAQLDYAALKADIKDYMRGSKLVIGVGKRHAASYLGEVVGAPARPSPQVLARRLVDRKYFDREQPRAPRFVHH